MLNYVHDIPTKIYFGKNQISQLESILKPLGKKVLLAYGGGSIKKTGLYDTVKKILDAGGFKVVELSGIAPNPRIESVVEGVALCKHHQIDVILAVGGGSVIDCSKAIAAAAYYEGDAWDLLSGRGSMGNGQNVRSSSKGITACRYFDIECDRF